MKVKLHKVVMKEIIFIALIFFGFKTVTLTKSSSHTYTYKKVKEHVNSYSYR